MINRFAFLHAATLALAAFAFAPAQAQPLAPRDAAILVLNQDRLLTQTAFGQRIQSELDAASVALAAENRQIEAQLTEEELELTERRPTMSPEDFRVLADEFDARVVAIRAAQDAKTRDLQAQAEAAQQRFFEETFPVLLDIVQSRGAAVLLDSRTVLLSAGSVDITDAAIVAIDEAMGQGGDAPLISLPGVTAPEQ
ncbi:OmpH/Skp family outer membrane protein [Gymnodinialimonas sp.]